MYTYRENNKCKPCFLAPWYMFSHGIRSYRDSQSNNLWRQVAQKSTAWPRLTMGDHGLDRGLPRLPHGRVVCCSENIDM